MRVTRSIVLCAAVAGSAMPASAGPLDWLNEPVLRGTQAVQPLRPVYQPGTPTYPRWAGFYFGGQIGMSFGSVNFTNATRSQISYILANTELQGVVSDWSTLPVGQANAGVYGGFIGYNVQWGEAITGIELNYKHTKLDINGTDTVGPILVAGASQSDGTAVQYRVIATSAAAVVVHDVATARARFGWAATERFMPYGFAGIAVGNTNVSRSTVLDVRKALTPPPVPDPITGIPVPQPQGPFNPVSLPRNPQIESKNTFAYGYTAGLGLEVGLMGNMFLRAEWEWINFASLKDTKAQLNSVHAGLGVRF